MKMIKKLNWMILLIAAVAIFSCGQQAGQVTLSSDGYGQTMFANGIKVLVNEDKSTSLTSARILIGGGVLSENAQNNGITNLMIKMLLKGNSTMTAAEISEKLDFLGIYISVDCMRDYSAISFTSLTDNFDQALEVISQCLLSPTFPEDELAKLKQEVKGDIRALNDNQSQVSAILLWKTAYGDTGYGLPTKGTLESLSSISVDDIRKHYQQYVGGCNMIFSVATDLPPMELMQILHNRLDGIKSEADIVQAPSNRLSDDKTGFIEFDRNQSFIYSAYFMDHLQPNEVASMVLLNEIMGSSVGSRLWDLRYKEKLAYAVYTQYLTDKYGALFRAAIGTDTSKVQTALTSLDREWNKLIKDGITEDEFRDARVNMKNNMIYRIDIKSNRANFMAYYEYVGYGYRFVLDLIKMADQATINDVNDFVKTRFTPDRKFIAVAGKM
jgi:zinc protease